MSDLTDTKNIKKFKKKQPAPLPAGIRSLLNRFGDYLGFIYFSQTVQTFSNSKKQVLIIQKNQTSCILNFPFFLRGNSGKKFPKRISFPRFS